MEKKNLVMVVLCVAIGIMAVAYAAFQTAITVEGTVQATADFKVEFQPATNPCVGTPADTNTPTPTAVASINSARIDFTSVNLYTPGDIITCTFPIKNTGDLQAKYSTHSLTEGSINENSTPIAFRVVSYPSTLVAKADAQNVVVEIKYNWTAETQPTTGLTGDFGVEFYYTQDLNTKPAA